jgi:glycosyltransferase involved in cell wall biosynthesis
MPYISVVIPAFRQAAFLGDAINSVLGQTFRDWEIIVAAGDEGCRSVANSYSHEPRIRVIDDGAKGNANARNVAIEAAHSPWIVTLDADDKIGAEFLSKALARMERGHNIISAQLQKFGTETSTWEIGEITVHMLAHWHHNVLPAMALFDRELWERSGGFENALPCYEDWEFWAKCSQFNPHVHVIQELLYFYRRHEDNGGSACGNHGHLMAMIRALNPTVYGSLSDADRESLRQVGGVQRDRILKRREWFPNDAHVRMLCELIGT